MNAIDDVIRKTLSAADAELFERYGADQALHRQVLEMFRGKLRWISTLGWIAAWCCSRRAAISGGVSRTRRRSAT